jgi:hypothetical protein
VTKRAMDLDGVPPPLPEPEQKDIVLPKPKTVKEWKGVIYGAPVDPWPEEDLELSVRPCAKCGNWYKNEHLRKAAILNSATLTPGLYRGAVCCMACRFDLGKSVALWDHL